MLGWLQLGAAARAALAHDGHDGHRIQKLLPQGGIQTQCVWQAHPSGSNDCVTVWSQACCRCSHFLSRMEGVWDCDGAARQQPIFCRQPACKHRPAPCVTHLKCAYARSAELLTQYLEATTSAAK